uniref:Uncharacterized protein n=1 Tax=uncultured prokaryote TaxID=198431 RepID=A0A0H5Q8Q5_9ZZZZ|nr:hypothetical protein [uncultured prokaryote]
MAIVAVNWRAGSNTATNVLGINPGENGPITTLNEILDALVGTIKKRVCDAWEIDSLVMSGEQPVAISGSDVNGLSDDCSTANVSYLIHKTPQDGRRGRMFLPGVSEGAIGISGDLSSGTVTAMNSECTNFLDALDVAGISLVVRPELVTISKVDFMTVDSRVATQRRRLRR